MKELIKNWLALPELLWKSFVFVLGLFWEDRKVIRLPKALFSMTIHIFKRTWGKTFRSTKHSCIGCKYFVKQSPFIVNWNASLRTKNVLLKDMPTKIDRDFCLLNHYVTLDSACSKWNDGLLSTEEERILEHNW